MTTGIIIVVYQEINYHKLSLFFAVIDTFTNHPLYFCIFFNSVLHRRSIGTFMALFTVSADVLHMLIGCVKHLILPLERR